MNYALYRLPYADKYVEVKSEHEAEILDSYSQVGRENGFVIAPFVIHEDAPLVLIHPDSVEEKAVKKVYIEGETAFCKEKCSDSYSLTFQKFHDAIGRGEFRKLVLSRKKTFDKGFDDHKKLFLEACQKYPRLMIMLVSTEETGTWLIATPEILLRNDGKWWRTMALAGTMAYKEGYQEWSEKNQQEQHYVESYIEECITCYGTEMLKEGPHTKRAGNLVHLCTDFHFHLSSDKCIGDLVASLHPTPAVCGIPKAEAQEFIVKNEGYDRRYYSGFMGPVGILGETHLYVSLRCAELKAGRAVLYAGGGIMEESEVESEWDETEQKMKTIKNVLR